MAARREETVAPEVKLTAQLLVDTERKIEILQQQIDQLEREGGPAPTLTPAGAPPSNPAALQRRQMEEQQAKLKSTAIGIVDDLQKTAKGKTQQDIEQLKAEWLIDNQPAQKGQDQDLRKKERDMNRAQSLLWKAAKDPEAPQTNFQQNARDVGNEKENLWERTPGVAAHSQTDLQQNAKDIGCKEASLMDRARGLQQEYSYLEPETNKKNQDKQNPEKTSPGKDDGLDLEPEEP